MVPRPSSELASFLSDYGSLAKNPLLWHRGAARHHDGGLSGGDRGQPTRRIVAVRRTMAALPSVVIGFFFGMVIVAPFPCGSGLRTLAHPC